MIRQPLRNRDHVERPGAVGKRTDGLEDEAVVVAVEILLRNHVGDAVPGGIVQHQPAEDGLLGFDGVRRHLECRGGEVGRTIGQHRFWHVTSMCSPFMSSASRKHRSSSALAPYADCSTDFGASPNTRSEHTPVRRASKAIGITSSRIGALRAIFARLTRAGDAVTGKRYSSATTCTVTNASTSA